MANGKEKPLAIRHSLLALLHSRHIKLRLLAGAVAAQRAVFTDRVGALEDPVLPGGESSEDAGLRRFRAGEAQIGFKPG